MKQDRERYITKLAEEIAENHSRGLKVDPNLIADKEGITVSDGKYGDCFEAMIEFCDKDREYPFHIYRNRDLIRPFSLRERSTMGHELGHYFIDEHKRRLLKGESLTYDRYYNYVENPKVEAEADCFSANLLLPSTKFIDQAEKLNYGMSAVIRLSNRFDTSRLSTALQYVKKDILHPSVLIKWTDDNRFHWKYVSPKFRKLIPDSYHFQFNPGRPTTDYDLITVKTGTDKAVFGSTLINLSSWIHNIRPGSHDDILMVEHTMRLGRYGGISLLCPAS